MSEFTKALEVESRTTNWNESKTKIEAYEAERDEEQRRQFFKPNEHNYKVMEMLKNVSPAYAKHAMVKNDLVRLFASYLGGGVDLLKQPICEKCEEICTWGTFDQIFKGMERACTCSACGHVTKNPITFEQYALEYLKGVNNVVLDAVRPKLNEAILFIDEEEAREKGEL